MPGVFFEGAIEQYSSMSLTLMYAQDFRVWLHLVTGSNCHPDPLVDWLVSGCCGSFLGLLLWTPAYLLPPVLPWYHVLNYHKILAIGKIVTLVCSFSQSPANGKALFHGGIGRLQKNKCQKSAENELENRRYISHEVWLCELEVLERQERNFRLCSTGLSYFSFDKRYITRPRKLCFKGNSTSLSLLHKSQFRAR